MSGMREVPAGRRLLSPDRRRPYTPDSREGRPLILKILTLLRHADASPATTHQDDHDRPLSARGVAACEALAADLAIVRAHPDLVLCSSAERAKETLIRLRPALDAGRVEHATDLYLASDDALLERLWGIEDGVARALVVAHNPGVQILTARLTGSGDADLCQRASSGFPAAALAELHFEVEGWAAIRDGSGRLARFVTPAPL